MSEQTTLSHNHPPKPCNPHDPWSQEMSQWYAQNYGEHPCNSVTVQWADLKPEDRLLDIGCGTGSAVRAAADLSRGQMVGMDFSPSMVAIAKAQTVGHPGETRIQFVEGEAGRLPFPNQSFHVITAVNSLHHWPNPQAGLAEAVRVLVPGGRLVVCEEIFDDSCRGMSLEDVLQILEDNGFNVHKKTTTQAGDAPVHLIEAVSVG